MADKTKEETMTKLVIHHPFNFTDYVLLTNTLDKLLAHYKDEAVTLVLAGSYRGSQVAQHYAKKNSLGLEVITPDWQKDGQQAAIKNNQRLAAKGDALIAFWDNMENSTKHMIYTMIAKQAPLRVVRY